MSVVNSVCDRPSRYPPRADLDALATALSRLSRFAAANADTIESLDINHFLVTRSTEP